MITKIYSIYDSKAKAHKQIHLYGRRDEAIRAFGAACNQEGSEWNNYAEDFALYELGELDFETGELKSYKQPLMIQLATSASTKHSDFYAKLQMTKLEAVS